MTPNHFAYVLDMETGTYNASTGKLTFENDVQASFEQATSITLNNVEVDDTVYTSVPAWYDATNGYLYSPVTGESYWDVAANVLTFTTPSPD